MAVSLSKGRTREAKNRTVSQVVQQNLSDAASLKGESDPSSPQNFAKSPAVLAKSTDPFQGFGTFSS